MTINNMTNFAPLPEILGAFWKEQPQDDLA
jgi:hypothetical protein